MNSSKLKLTALLLMTLVPILLATWYYSVSINGSGRGTTNKGVLVQPVLDLVELDLRDDEGNPAYLGFEELTAGVDPDDYEPRPWQLLFISSADCDESCLERLYFLRQVHIRLGKDSDRVRRAFVLAEQSDVELDQALGEELQREHPDMRILRAEPASLRAQLDATAAGRDPVAENFIYVADPLGNIMLYFTPENPAEEMLDDIDKLLDQSSLG